MKSLYKLVGTNERPVTASGSALKVLGKVQDVIISLVDNEDNVMILEVSFIVVDGLRTDIILGMDFLVRNNAILDMASFKLSIKNRSFDLVRVAPGSLQDGRTIDDCFRRNQDQEGLGHGYCVDFLMRGMKPY